MFYSLDNGATFTRLPVPGFTFDNVVTGPGQGFNNGASIEGGYKVGLFAFGGPEGQIPATFAFDYFTANGGTDTWNLPGSGVYDNDSSWTLLTPSSVDATALFGSSITSDATVTINGEHNVGTVTFDSTHSYTIAGAGTLTFNSWDTYSGTTPVTVPAGINVLNGNHTISSNVNMAKSMVVNVVNGTNSVTITNGLASTGTLTTLTKTGAGALILKNLNLAAGAAVNAGTVSILPNGTNAGTSRLGTLSLGGGATPTGSFDLNDNDLVITSGDEATVQGWVRNARNNGNWNQPGLTSSTARTNPSHNTTIGVLSGAEYKSMNGASSTFDGSPVADTDVLAKYTYYGDTDFNGKVNFDDYVRTDNGFNNHLSGWMNGDFDLNGQVNFDDYVLIDLAFNTQSGTLGRALGFVDGSDGSVSGMDNPALRQVQRDVAQFGDAYVRGFLAAVPEPAAFGMLAAMAILGATNRRRRQK
jgi:hypothetical protein